MEGRSISDTAIRDIWSGLWRAPAGRWPAIRWGLATILPAAMVLWGISLLLAPGEPDILTIRALSQVTGEGIEGAQISVGEGLYVADESGEIRIAPLQPGTTLAVSALGYESGEVVFSDEDGHDLTIYLNGVLVMGAVTDAVSGEPIVGAQVTALDVDGHAFSSTGTDRSGGFIFKSIPEDARLQVVDPLYGEAVHSIDGRQSVQLRMDPPPVRGRVVDPSGQPIEGARVSAPTSRATSTRDGGFMLDPVGQGAEIEVFVEGYGTTVIIIEGADLGDVVLIDPATPPSSSGNGT